MAPPQWPTLKEAFPAFPLPLLILEIPESCATPLGQAVGQVSSASLPAFQKALAGESEQVGVKRAAIRGRLESCAYLIRRKECPGALENRQDLGFGHSWCPSCAKKQKIRNKEKRNAFLSCQLLVYDNLKKSEFRLQDQENFLHAQSTHWNAERERRKLILQRKNHKIRFGQTSEQIAQGRRPARSEGGIRASYAIPGGRPRPLHAHLAR